MKTNETVPQRLLRTHRRALWLALFAGACGGSVTKAPSVGSESHFLEHCAGGCEGGLDCIGGICTRPCLTEQSSCAALAVNAACTNQSVEPGQVAVCDVSCAGATGCGALGVDYACESGYCRKASSSSSGGSGDGSGSMVGSSGAGPTIGSAGSSTGGASDGVPGVDCRPVGRYQVGKVGGYLPCCPGLTQLSTWVEETGGNGLRACEQVEVNSYSCISGSCGDGICEDAEAPCGCGVDCPDSNWRASEASCERFRDQSPPPDIRTISITNTGSVPLYIQTTSADDCTPLLLQVQRYGQSVNLSSGPGCAANCQKVMDDGWPNDARSCAGLNCARPTPIQIQPGQALQEPVTLEVVTQQLPRACAAGIVSDSVECFSRVIPQPGNYILTVRAALALECSSALDCDCRPGPTGACTNPNVALTSAPLVFDFPSTWYFQNQELQIAAPGS